MPTASYVVSVSEVDGLSKLSSTPFADGETEVWTNNLMKGIQLTVPSFQTVPIEWMGNGICSRPAGEVGAGLGLNHPGTESRCLPSSWEQHPQDECKYTGTVYRQGTEWGTRQNHPCPPSFSSNYRAIRVLGAGTCTVWEADPQGVLCLSRQWMH